MVVSNTDAPKFRLKSRFRTQDLAFSYSSSRPMMKRVSSESMIVAPSPPKLCFPRPDLGKSSSVPHALSTYESQACFMAPFTASRRATLAASGSSLVPRARCRVPSSNAGCHGASGTCSCGLKRPPSRGCGGGAGAACGATTRAAAGLGAAFAGTFRPSRAASSSRSASTFSASERESASSAFCSSIRLCRLATASW